MQVLLVILTSTLLSACFLITYRIGYKDGLSHKDPETLTVDDNNKKMLKEYINFLSFNGDEKR